jgi:lipopolysaccharide transport system permease protein
VVSPLAEKRPLAHLLIRPGAGRGRLQLAELWNYRDLLYFLTLREITIRYKQTLLGSLWAVLQPTVAMVVFSIFFGGLARVPSDGMPYPLFSYLGLLPWTYFSNALTRCGASLVGNANLLTKVYFPRVLIPLSATLSALVDFALAFVVLLGLMAYYRVAPDACVLLVLPLSLLIAVLATGVGMALAALNVQYRDVQHAVPFLVQLWMYTTPVVYPASLVPEPFRPLYQLNPMVGIIDAYRAAPLGRPIDWLALAITTAVTVVVTWLGFRLFQRTERVFADVV